MKGERKYNKELDSIDLKILRIIQENSNLSVKEIASRVNLSSTPVFERIKRLERTGVIKKYVAVLDADKLNMGFSVFCNVKLRSISHDTVNAFARRICECREVTECYSVSGQYNFMLRVRVPDMHAYRDFILKVLGEIDSVASVDSSFVMSEEKNSYSIML